LSSNKKDAKILIKLKDENDKLKKEVKSVSHGYSTLLKGEYKYGEMLAFKAVNYEKTGLGYPPFKETCKPAPSIKIEKPK
jgi:hypothetical protein